MHRGAGILLRAHDTGNYLFLRELDGLWGIPGGHAEWGEDAQDTALREFVEETGFHGRLLLSRQPVRIGDYHLFGGEVERQFTPVLSGEHTAYAWAVSAPLPKRSLLSSARL
jgi:ADP-ribose pyrophosphatase YjhB (NUDIX family)